MLEDNFENKLRDVFSDMVVLKNPERTEFFSNLSLPSYMRDWLVMKFQMTTEASITTAYCNTSANTYQAGKTTNSSNSR